MAIKLQLKSEAAKAEVSAALAIGKTTAKSAGTSAKKPKALAAAAAKAKQANEKWERPGLNALCRKLVGGDMAAGVLLFHILYEWRNRHSKLERHGQMWLAHTREAWAGASGLTFDELVKRAVPRLKKNCTFLTIRAMGHGSDKRLWISLDEIELQEAVYGSQAMPWDMFWASVNGIGPGNHKAPASAYETGPK